MAEASATTEDRPAYRWIVLAALGFIYVLNFLDRQIMAVLAEPIKQELQLSDTEVGLLAGPVFAIFYTFVGLPVGWLADRTHRVRLIAISCVMWSAFTAACGLAQNFAQLAFTRIGVGIGEAGGTPPSYSIIADYFPKRRRAAAMAFYSVGAPLGLALGAALGAAIADQYGWRAAFIFAGAPGVVAAILLLLIVREPRRGGADIGGDATPSVPIWSTIGLFWSSPVLRSTVLATSLAAFVGYATLAWTTPFLIREKQVKMAEIATFYSLLLLVAMGAGALVSGWIADSSARRQPQAYATIPAWAFLLGMPFFLGFLFAPDWRLSLALLAAPSFLNIMYLAPSLTVIQNHTPPAQRTTAAAILVFVVNIIGLGGGPLAIGVLSDMAQPAFADHALQVALTAIAPVSLAAAGAYFLSARALARAAGAHRDDEA